MIPFYWPFETSVPFKVCFSAAKSSVKSSLKYRKIQRHITALRGENVRAILKALVRRAIVKA